MLASGTFCTITVDLELPTLDVIRTLPEWLKKNDVTIALVLYLKNLYEKCSSSNMLDNRIRKQKSSSLENNLSLVSGMYVNVWPSYNHNCICIFGFVSRTANRNPTPSIVFYMMP